MSVRYAVAALLAIGATPLAAACPECTTTAGHKASSVIPADNANSLNKFGDGFSNQVFNLNLQGNRTATVKLGFTAKIGGSSFEAVNVNENGILSFGARNVASKASATGGDIPFRNVDSLKEFGLPVIATFYADLQQGERGSKSGPEVGQIFVQYGVADPTPDANGVYSIKDAVNATRITWYGLPVGQTADSSGASLAKASNSDLAWAQILFTDMGDGNFNFEFRSGDPSQDAPYSQPGLGSIAGFYLNDQLTQFKGPYDDRTPNYFAFRDGALVAGNVPETASWLLLILGFGFVGFCGRQRTRKLTFVLQR